MDAKRRHSLERDLSLLPEIFEKEFPEAWENTRNLLGLFSIHHLLRVMDQEAEASKPNFSRVRDALEVLLRFQENNLWQQPRGAADFFNHFLQSRNLPPFLLQDLHLDEYMAKFLLDSLDHQDLNKLAWHLATAKAQRLQYWYVLQDECRESANPNSAICKKMLEAFSTQYYGDSPLHVAFDPDGNPSVQYMPVYPLVAVAAAAENSATALEYGNSQRQVKKHRIFGP